ncbi:MAG: T9SS type A sorting domain-containing protein [Chitinophagales bacterium]|nr:T9SS type A sorting domain-containing protein [Chitinophagales bacterium]
MKTIFTSFFLFFTLFLFAQDCDNRYQADLFTNVDVTTVKYGEAMNRQGVLQELYMDIYQGQGDTASNRPVVLFCFGGSFYTGSRTSQELVYFATELAKKGYVCASIDYRLATSVIDLIQEEVMVKVVFGAVQDGKAAIRFFREDAATTNTYKVDSNQIFIGGTSAGGILSINLAYVDDLEQLPTTWQTWADEIGGIEGSSGNPGHCSYVNGVFGFAGAVGDTAYIEANDPPFYGCHSTGDQTVLFGYGAPLNGFAPVSLYGSSLIEARMNNLGIYNSVDVYSGSNHPPLNNQTRLTDTKNNLSEFLFNILDCNSNDRKLASQKSCEDFSNPSTGIVSANPNYTWTLYPNPAKSQINIEGLNATYSSVHIYDALGREVFYQNLNGEQNLKINIENFVRGVYFVSLNKGQAKERISLLVD